VVLKRLARDSDAVLMDLRGFLPDNQGCVFEINELLNVMPLDRVVFVVDATTDLAFLRETFAAGWAALAADSPNRDLAEPRVLLFEFAGGSSVPGLMRAVGRRLKAGRGAVADFLASGLPDGIYNKARPTPEFATGIVAPYSDEEGKISIIRNASSLNTNHTTMLVERHGDTGAPTLCLWGVHDPWQTIADGERLSREIPNARLVRVENA